MKRTSHRVVEAKTVIYGLCFDLERMAREEGDKNVVIKRLRETLALLDDKKPHHKAIWWNERRGHSQQARDTFLGVSRGKGGVVDKFLGDAVGIFSDED